jgi:hypothetical protein
MIMPVRTCQIQPKQRLGVRMKRREFTGACDLFATRPAQALAEVEHLATLAQLRRYLTTRQDGMHQEQREYRKHCRLRDVVILEHGRQPVEATLACQD